MDGTGFLRERGQIETGRINDLSNLMFLLDFLTEPELTTATISPRIADLRKQFYKIILKLKPSKDRRKKLLVVVNIS